MQALFVSSGKHEIKRQKPVLTAAFKFSRRIRENSFLNKMGASVLATDARSPTFIVCLWGEIYLSVNR
jgi:hypothetical protein